MIDESVKNEIVEEISQKLNLKFQALEREIKSKIDEATASQTAELKAEMEKQKKEMIAVLTETIKSLQETQEYHLKVSIATLKEQRELSEDVKEALDDLLELAQKSGQNVVKIAELGEKAGEVQIVIDAQKMLEEQKELLDKIYKEVVDNKEGIKVAAKNSYNAVDRGNRIIEHQNQWFPHIVKEVVGQLKKEMTENYNFTRDYLSDIDGNMKVTKEMVKSLYQARY